jgi:hypothetical protein
MKTFLQVALCCCLAAGVAVAQRGGGGSRGGGGGGARMGGGGGFRGSASFSHGGGFVGGGGSGFRGGGSVFRGGFGGFRGGFGGFRGFRGFYGGGYWPYYGFGYSSYWPGYWGGYYDYGYDTYPSYGYPSSYSYPAYQPSSNVTVVYPQSAQTAPNYVERANPNMRQYDEYGQEIRQPAGNYGSAGTSTGGSGSPLYLIAFRDHSIRAAAAYWVDGNTLHYVTSQHEERQAPLDTIDRDFSLQLNRERHVQFSLPSQQ